MKEQLWIVDEDFVIPKKEMDYPSAKSDKTTSKSKPRSILRINTSQQDLHDRYLSSEEELSPSPDDGPHEFVHELKQKPDIFVDDAMDDAMNLSMDDFQTEIATAMPILASGRPKLIDITNLAPMHKRKRLAKPSVPHLVPKNGIANRPASAASPPPAASASSANGQDENQPHPIPDLIPAVSNPARQQLKRKESFAMQPPESWLPEDLAEVDEPQLHLPIRDRPSPAHRRHPNHTDRHPLSIPLDTSDRPSHRSAHYFSNRSAHYFSTRVLDADLVPSRPPTPSSPPLGSPSAAWKGLTRSLSLVKRHSNGVPAVHPAVMKKPKMIPRGANEREDAPVIPPFPFEGNLAVAAS